MAVLDKTIPSVTAWSLLSHKQKKNRKFHEKRRVQRRKLAQTRDKDDVLSDEVHVSLEKEKLKEDEENKAAEKAWLDCEAVAQTAFVEKQMELEKRQKEKEELKRRIREEFKALEEHDKILAPDISKIKAIDQQDREEMLKQFDNLIEEAKEEAYSNPLAPASYPQYGTELDVKYCSFYLKTGACRFGDRCSRYHMRPPSSDTILLPALFQHISLGEDFMNDHDTDSCLEHENVDTNKTFAEFFWDVFPEFQAVGQVVMFKVCCNHEPHLRGNVYVQYQDETEAVRAFAKFNGRFYASRQMSCEFIKIDKWKSAICGQFHRNRCPKGKTCNFLHVFKNPGGLFMVHGSEVSATPNKHIRNSGAKREYNRAAGASEHNNQNIKYKRRSHYSPFSRKDSQSPRRGGDYNNDRSRHSGPPTHGYRHSDRNSQDKIQPSRQRSNRDRPRFNRDRSHSPRK